MAALVNNINSTGLGRLPKELLLREGDPILRVCGEKAKSGQSGPWTRGPKRADEDVQVVVRTGPTITYTSEWTLPTTTTRAGSVDPLDENQKEGCKAVRQLMEMFFQIVLKQVQDYVPKSLSLTLIYNVVDNVGKELSKKITTTEKIADLMTESKNITDQRDAVNNDLKVLYEARQLLDDVREKTVL